MIPNYLCDSLKKAKHMEELVKEVVLKKRYTISKLLYGAKEEAVSGLCLHCVHWSLWRAGHRWSFGHELSLNRPLDDRQKNQAHRFL